MDFKKIFRQMMLFFISSGIGFIIDFSVYLLLVKDLEIRVLYANMISALPAVTFVFIISNTRIFSVEKTNIKDKIRKYFIYLGYQAVLLACVSYLGDYIYFNHTEFLTNMLNDVQIKLLIKVFITPITMILNFIVMKFLTERIK